MPRGRQPMETYIQLAPRVTERPRLGRRGRVFTPERTLNAEKAIAKAWKRKFGRRKPLDGPVQLEVHFDKHGQTIRVSPHQHRNVLRGDLDNYVKLVSDALNGIAYLDDKQISRVVATCDGQHWTSRGSDAMVSTQEEA